MEKLLVTKKSRLLIIIFFLINVHKFYGQNSDLNFSVNGYIKYLPSYLDYNLKPNKLIPPSMLESQKIHLIHISTDQVYDSKFASEENQTNISNIYGVTKFLGELETLNYKESLILRTNFFGKSFSKKRNSYSDYIINNLSKNNKIRIPSNVFFNPIHIESLNSIILKLIKKRAKGIINIGSKDVISKFNFAKLIAKKKKLSKRFLSSYQSVYLVNKRPLSTFMSTKKLRKTINIKIPSIYDEIKRL